MSFKPRCNTCFATVDSAQSLFTSCGHFVCKRCKSSKMSREMDVCPFCGESCSILFLDGNLPEEVKLFIQGDPMDMVSQSLEILRFQENHKRLYMDHIQRQFKLQREKYNQEIDSLKQEIERLRRSSSFQTPIQTPSRPTPSFGPLKRPDFMSRFKSTMHSAQIIHQPPPPTPSLPQTPIASTSSAPTNNNKRYSIERLGTPSFVEQQSEKRTINPFTKSTPTRQPKDELLTPTFHRRGVEVPGSITRHPQLAKTPQKSLPKSTPSLPFQLLRAPKSAPTIKM